MNATERIARSRSCGRQGCPCTRWKPGGNVHCPCHDDHNPSLSLSEAADGKVLVHDQAGCSSEEVIEALREQGLWPEAGANGSRPEQQATYEYHAADGGVWGRVLRKPGKQFPVQRPDGKGGWLWGWTDKETGQALVTRTLYRLPELLAANRDDWVFVVEGEKDANRLASLGLTSTTNPGGASKKGAKSKWRPEYSETLAGRKVAVIPDHDEAGLAHAQAAAKSLAIVAADVRLVELPAEEIGDDVSDWLDRGGTKEGLLAKVEAAQPWALEDTAIEPFRSHGLDEILGRVEEPLDAIIGDGSDGAVLTSDGKGCIAGPTGVGKTNMLLRLSRSLADGSEFLGLPIPHPRKVLYLLLEGSARATRRRLDKIWKDSTLDARGRFRIAHLALDLGSDDLPRLYSLLEKDRPEVLFIDPLREAHGGDENVSHEMKRVTTILDGIIDRYGCAIILAHHDRKRPPFTRRDAGTDRLRGSTAFTGWLSFALSLEADPSGEDRLFAEWLKTRDAEQPLERLAIDFDRDTLDFSLSSRAVEGKISPDAILTAVFQQGGSARGVELVQGFVKGAGASDRWVKQQIRDLVEAGKLDEFVADADRKTGAKTYCLPPERHTVEPNEEEELFS